eukprot:gene17974-23606_t
MTNSVLKRVFGYLHHPGCPSDGELILSQKSSWDQDFSDCNVVYATRSGVRQDETQPSTCVSIVRLPDDGHGYYSPQSISHRNGSTKYPQILKDQYQEDYYKEYMFPKQNSWVEAFLKNRDSIIQSFIKEMGDPIDPKTGSVPREAADTYADRTFTKLMWLKVTSVYVALYAGFDVIFQDADLVWIKDPTEFLHEQKNYDMIFMDDGARTMRFGPLFTNTGFYYIRNCEKTLYLQEKLIRSAGQMYHHQQEYVNQVKKHEIIPYVWHMCWTDNREQKVHHLKDIGMWFLQESEFMQDDIVTKVCCVSGDYWKYENGNNGI